MVLPEGAVGSGEIRGGAPATREFGLLDPQRSVQHIDGVVLSGGSAFGLAAAQGVAEFFEESGRGFPTAHGRVPIVVGMSLYDLGVGDPGCRPGPVEGRLAVESARPGPFSVGQVGAGTGATVGKWAGRERATPGGLGTATMTSGEVLVSALIAVNAVGFIDDGRTEWDLGPPVFGGLGEEDQGAETVENTTIGILVTNAALDKVGCHLLAQSGHDGMARSLLPAHTPADGDALVAVATGTVDADPFHVRLLAQQAVAAAIRSAALSSSQ